MSVLKFKNPDTGEYEVLIRGKKGDKGDTGGGVAAGGTAGQILGKKSGTNYDTEWIDKPTSGVWGQITGTLSDQTDLNSALTGKANSSHTHSTTDLTATGGTTTSFLRKDNTWATPTNTTYSEITSAEITGGTASTARAISGRMAQEIVNKAQTGVVKSSTTAKLTTGSTAPASPSEGDVWVDTSSSVFPVGTSDIANGAVTSSKIDWATFGLPVFISPVGSQSISGNSFTTLSPGTPAVKDTLGGNWNGSIYTIPQDGVYMLIGTARVSDTVTTNGYGFGIGTVTADGADNYWQGTGATRKAAMYTRIASLSQGDLIRPFIYVDAAGTVAVSNITMQILKIG